MHMNWTIRNKYIFIGIVLWSCNNADSKKEELATAASKDSITNCGAPHSRAAALAQNSTGDQLITLSNNVRVTVGTDTASWPSKPWPQGMVWVPGGEFTMGGVGNESRPDEFPLH